MPMMDDTTKQIQEMLTRVMMEKTPTERLEIASRMFSVARNMVEAGLLRENPLLNRAQLRARVFMRFYGHEFSQAQIARIMNEIPDMQLD